MITNWENMQQKEGDAMNMQEVKELIYKGEKVDVECKKAENTSRDLHMNLILSLPIQKAGTLFLVSMKIKRRRLRKSDLSYKGLRILPDSWKISGIRLTETKSM